MLALIEVAVAAALKDAARRAAVAKSVVAVVASLIAFIVRPEITALNAVAAARRGAAGRTGVGIDLITIVTGFALIDASVATDLGAAGR